MSKRGENIYLRKDKRWEGRYQKYETMDGNSHFGYIYGKSYQEVKEKLLQKKYENRIIPTDCPSSITSLTISRAAALWVEHQAIRVKESTLSTYRSILSSQIIPVLGDTPIVKLTSQHVDAYIKKKLESGLSPKYVKEILAVLKSVARLAERLYHIPYSLSFSAVPHQQLYPVRVLCEEEYVSMAKTVFQSDDMRQQGILLCLYTGLRIGELCALKWSDFSPDFKSLHIARTMQRICNPPRVTPRTKVIVSSPKTGTSFRTIPIPDRLASHWKKLAPPNGQDGFFLTGAADRYIEPRLYQAFFARFLSCNGYRAINFHALRHTFATRCIQKGADAKSLSEILGHARVEITLNRYVHTSMEQKQRCVDLLVSI